MPSDSRFEDDRWLPLELVEDGDDEAPELLLPPGHSLVVLQDGRCAIAVDVLDIGDYRPAGPLTAP